MNQDLVTTLSDRGQASIPALLRKKLALQTGQRLRWQQISDTEMRIEVVHEKSILGPAAMRGFARQFNPQDHRGTDEIMAELREGESN